MSTSSSRSEEHTSELQSHGTISYAVFCLKKKKKKNNINYLIINKKIIKIIQQKNLYYYFINKNNLFFYILLFNFFFFFFFNDTATTEIYTVPYTLSLHDALPISRPVPRCSSSVTTGSGR